jgi:hypothetical protein
LNYLEEIIQKKDLKMQQILQVKCKMQNCLGPYATEKEEIEGYKK